MFGQHVAVDSSILGFLLALPHHKTLSIVAIPDATGNEKDSGLFSLKQLPQLLSSTLVP
jgi:hypothetical protein